MKKLDNKVYSNKGNFEVLSEVPVYANYILDIGCGNGDNARLLKTRGCIIDGITLSLDEASNAKKYCDNVYIHNCEAGLPIEILANSYDVIICSHVLEHISYPEVLLSDIKKALNLKGILVVALPNIFHYKSRIELLKGNFHFHESGVWDYTHLRWYSFKSGKNFFQRQGYVLTKAYVSGDLPLLTIFRFLPLKFRKLLFKVLISISPGLFGNQLIFVLKS